MLDISTPGRLRLRAQGFRLHPSPVSIHCYAIALLHDTADLVLHSRFGGGNVAFRIAYDRLANGFSKVGLPEGEGAEGHPQ